MNNHSHSHSHDTSDVSDKVLLWSVAINLGLSLFEFIAGIISGSMALIADALHNTNDVGALVIAYIARKISKKKPDEQFTFGYQRAELIGAMLQLTALLVVGLFLVYEGLTRLWEPKPLLGGWIMIAAGIAFVVDIGTVWLLWTLSKGSMNVRAAFLHNVTDAGASIAVLLGGAAVYWLNWTWVDPAISLLIAAYILWMSFGMLKRTSILLMESTPPGIDLKQLTESIHGIEGVQSIHHLRVWQFDENNNRLMAHVVCLPHIEDLKAVENIKKKIKQLLANKFNIEHATLEFEHHASACKEL